MLDLGWAELLLVAVVALIVVGPKDLPAALRTVTGYVRQARAMAREFQRGLEDIAKDSGIQEIKRDLQESVGLGLEDDIKEALTVDFDDDEPKKIGGKFPGKATIAKTDADEAVDPTTGENAIMDPELAKQAKMAAKPAAAVPTNDSGPEETPKPDIVSDEVVESAKKPAEKPTKPAKVAKPAKADNAAAPAHEAATPAPEEASNRA